MMKRKYPIILMLFIVSIVTASADDKDTCSFYKNHREDLLRWLSRDKISFVPKGNYNPRKQVGFFSSDNATLYVGDYKGLNPLFEGLDNYGVEPTSASGAGINYRRAMTTNLFLFGTIGYKKQAFTLTGEQPVTLIYNDGPGNGLIKHNLNYDLVTINSELMVGRNFWRGLFGMTGFSLNFYANRTLDYSLNLESPDGTGVFKSNGSSELSLGEMEESNENFYSISFVLGAGYRFPLIRIVDYGDISITPYFTFHHNIGGNSSNFQSNLASVESAFSIEYSFEEKSRKPIDAAVKMSYVSPENPRDSVLRTNVKITQRYIPILNFVFFEEGDTDIPKRYNKIKKRDTESFYETEMQSEDPLEIYRNILNIVGRRMKSNPDSKITLTRSLLKSESRDLAEFSKCAEEIVDYLEDTWEIEPERIATDTLPEIVSRRDFPASHIKIKSNTPSLFSPVAISDTTETLASNAVVFDIEISEDDLHKWDFQANFAGDTVRYKSRSEYDNNSVHVGVPPEKLEAIKNGKHIDYRISIDGGIDYKDLQLAGSSSFKIEREESVSVRYCLVWLNDLDFTRKDVLFFPAAGVAKARMNGCNFSFNAYVGRSLNPMVGESVAKKRVYEIIKEENDIPENAPITITGPAKLPHSEQYPEGAIYNRCVEMVIGD
jgi:hypothetical protein